MTPRPPRVWRCLALTFSALLALAACAPSVAWQRGLGEPSGPAFSEGPSPSPSQTQEPIPPALAPYVARIPIFSPAPTPIPVALPHTEGRAAFAYEIPTTQPVAFLTIDDGAVRHPMAMDLVKAAKIPVTLFLTTNYVAGYQDYFRNIRDAGRVMIEDHTISHPELPSLGYADQRRQLCGANDLLEQWYGQRPTIFRPPYGDKNDDTLRAAWSCGLVAGFHWRETVDAGNVYYQRPDHLIHPGDIILMHFRVAFPDDFLAALQAIKNSGLTPALLEDYVSIGPGTPPPPAAPPPATTVTTAPPPPPPTDTTTSTPPAPA